MIEKYKEDQEFYSLVGIKPETFHKMVKILKIAESKNLFKIFVHVQQMLTR